MRKRLVILGVVPVLFSLTYAVSSAYGSSIKNGVNCAKASAKAKVGSKVYVCSKNPFIKSNRLTWVLSSCMKANSLLKQSREEYENWEGLAKLAGPDGEKTLADLKASITSLEESMKSRACKRGA